ncbi:MAG: hypothetical protein V1790_09780 [Planctomycetota bacterium]
MSSALERLKALRSERHAPDALPPPGIAAAELPPDWRIEYEERAAIREYDGGQLREYAERAALRETVERMRAVAVNPKKRMEST